ncbi:MAG: hypothetical protein IPF56_06605 [Chloroflexi bacterium]|nr:hypothetical protein [Chloroflexota bacterium]MBK6708903.1 hypothetical protein [Chloroflexota bacterium]
MGNDPDYRHAKQKSALIEERFLFYMLGLFGFLKDDPESSPAINVLEIPDWFDLKDWTNLSKIQKHSRLLKL